jgi:L-ascorbate metabolism protein UlaG (beta-lactamase superfamily)
MTKPRFGRRTWLAGAGLCALEGASLTGAFDHRRAVRATARERYRAALADIDRAGRAVSSIVHIGHSTHLVAIGGQRLLTDPWFSDPAFGALAHAAGPAVRPEELGPVDAILISHDHADHADLAALDGIEHKRSIPVIVGDAGLAARARRVGFANVHALSPWERLPLGPGVDVHAVPALHDVPEIGFVIAGGRERIYFAGDSQLFEAHAAIAERLAPSFAILPVDGTRIRGGRSWVMDPTRAIEAARVLGVRAIMPSHADARFSDPFVGLALATTVSGAAAELARRARAALPGVTCHVPVPGDRVVVSA